MPLFQIEDPYKVMEPQAIPPPSPGRILPDFRWVKPEPPEPPKTPGS